MATSPMASNWRPRREAAAVLLALRGEPAQRPAGLPGVWEQATVTDLILWLGDNSMAVFALAVIALLVHWLYDVALGG